MRKGAETTKEKSFSPPQEVQKFGDNFVDMDYVRSFKSALNLLDSGMARLRVDNVAGKETVLVIRLGNNEQLFMTDSPEEVEFLKNPKKGLQFIEEVIENPSIQ